MKRTSEKFFERCKIFDATSGNDFVGIEIKKDEIHITFPMGYNTNKDDEDIARKDIILLLHTLKSNIKTKISVSNPNDKNVNFYNYPIQSYQYIITQFLKYEYYVEKDVIYTSGKRGKINWKRTIQQKKPFINNNSVIYLDFITKKNVSNEHTLLRYIHEHCVYISFLKLGWLYTNYMPNKPQYPFNKKLFLSIIKQSLQHTFDDRNKQLLDAMYNVILECEEGSEIPKEYEYGTNDFEYIWENMIDRVYGDVDKDKYFPRTKWNIINYNVEKTNVPLRLDTIINYDKKIYIIDAKYYKYGITKKNSDLPSTSSIQKQITYGEYLTSEAFKGFHGNSYSEDSIYNAFLMPSKETNIYEYVGYATADWKNNNYQYEYVIAILINTKYLMEICREKNIKEIKTLTSIIMNESNGIKSNSIKSNDE